jgi:serine/threonine protein phosphatase PrpC
MDEVLGGVKKGIHRGFLELDEKLRKIPEVASGEDKSGTTAVGALITEKYLIIANCGDSRGVICVEGQPAVATQDHKPSNEPERERIQNAGGSVMIQRVNGSLAVSRALGDFEYKNVDGKGPTEQLVSPEPEFYIKEREKDKDEFLVLACDGVWDVMSNEDICNFISARMKVTDNLETICNEVIDTCLYKGSRDNMSIIIVAFANCPKVCPAAVKLENELNSTLEKKVTDLIASHDNDVELSTIHQLLAEEDLPGLPPGGGIAAKKVFIEDVYKKVLPDRFENTQDECPNPLASLLFTNAAATSAEDGVK